MTTGQLEPSQDDLEQTTLDRVDYADAFVVGGAAQGGRDGEMWARSMLEGAPLVTRAKLLAGWASLGLRLRPPGASGTVLGWPVVRQAPDHLLLGADSPLGLHGQLLFRPQPDGFRFATIVQLDHAAARALWAGVVPVHQRVVASLLRRLDDSETRF